MTTATIRGPEASNDVDFRPAEHRTFSRSLFESLSHRIQTLLDDWLQAA